MTSIEFGIDLGTSNSVIARQNANGASVIDSEEGILVPSVVHIGADQSITVGKKAVALGLQEAANVAAEFKRVMGAREQIFFPAAGGHRTPVELSAEVLKFLLRRAQQQKDGEPVEASVITI